MEGTFETYARLKEEHELLQIELKELQRPYREQIEQLENQMKEATKHEWDTISKRADLIKELGDGILNSWTEGGPATVELESGTKVVRSTHKSVRVNKKKDLLEGLLSMIKDEEKLPFTIKWDDKGIIPLLDANVIPPDIATIETTYRLSVRKPKD